MQKVLLKRVIFAIVLAMGSFLLMSSGSVSVQAGIIKEGSEFSVDLPGKVKPLEMVWIKPGTFTMGSPEGELGRRENEVQHKVTLTKGYWLGKYEVIQEQYMVIMGKNPSKFMGDNLPVEQVSWDDAMEFCEKFTASEKVAGRLPKGYKYTLPTEAQWEYACRAGTTTALNNGRDLPDKKRCSEIDEVGWYFYNTGGLFLSKTFPVGQKKPNIWGLYDMHGNVDEWCLDWYGDYPTSGVIDPMGPNTGTSRAIHGGSGMDMAEACRSATRYSDEPTSRSKFLGFRLALVPVQ